MFKERRQEDEKLKKLLRESWPADSDDDRRSFLKRLKIILQPDHPGLLCMPGRSKTTNGAARDNLGATRWRLHGVLATVAAYGFIIVAAGALLFGLKYVFTAPSGESPETDMPVRSATVIDDEIAGEITGDHMRFVYRFRDIEITRDKRLTIAQLTEEINDCDPVDEIVTITGMKQIDSYESEEHSVLYKVYVFQLEGFWKPEEDNKTDEENGLSSIN